ncbi:hypothetical protein N431DRAFT_367489 [Stipitochalara longipes BDJ]|nr:hypothetical protein N431DRAFT_367489 [Stipitochalara longipes BDJ]
MDPFSALNIATSVAQFLEFGCSLVSNTAQIYHSAHGATVSHVETTFAARRLLELSERMKASLRDQTLLEPPGSPPDKPQRPIAPTRVDSTSAGNLEYDKQLEAYAVKMAEFDKESEIYPYRKAEFEGLVERYPRAKKSLEALCEICDNCITLSKELLAKLDELRLQGPKHRKFKSLLLALKSVWSTEAICDLKRRLESHRRELSDHLLAATCEKLNVLSIKEPESELKTDTRFKSLELSHQKCIDDLRNVLQSVITKAHGQIGIELATLRELLESMQKEKLAKAEGKYVEEQRQLDEKANFTVLRHLWFETLSTRREEIAEAHKSTFAWIFEDPETVRSTSDIADNTRPWTNFVKWLRDGENIYWVNGKAGSGKSTLMKYVRESPETLTHLRKWAGSAELRVAGFYFWNSGSREQYSQLGLFRSLLYQILCKRQDLIRFVFGAEWDVSRDTKHIFDNFSMQECVQSLRRLREAFTSLVNLASKQVKLCFFVDGLDEYEGGDSDGPEGIIKVFTDIPQSTYLKICLSSRPWFEFEEAFKNGPKLRLQDLTYRDIRLYVNDKLGSHPLMIQLSRCHPEQTATFVTEILSKANGVFLWIVLVTKSLLDGLKYGDDISNLQNRLKTIPPRLEDLYTHMLNGVDKYYISHASRIFQIYHSASDINVRPNVLELDLAFTATYADAMTEEREVMSQENILERCNRMLLRLKVWCGGLLEAHDHLDSTWEAKEDTDDLSRRQLPALTSSEVREVEDSRMSQIKAAAKVSYLHRTARDYLKKDFVRAKLEENTKPSLESEPFDPNISLLMSYLINFKQSVCSFYLDTQLDLESRVWSVVENICHLAQNADSSKTTLVVALLEEFHEVGGHMFLRTSMLPDSPFRKGICPSHSFEWWEGYLFVAVRFGLCEFVERCLLKYRAPQIPPTLPGHTILVYALGLSADNFPGNFPIPEQPAFSPMIDLLLRCGEDPNTVLDSCTVWEYCLHAYRTDPAPTFNKDVHYRKWTRILGSMLHHGAAINPATDALDLPHFLYPWKFEETQDMIKYGTHQKPQSLEALINDLATKAPPDAAALLRQIYAQRKCDSASKSSASGFSSSTTRKRPRDNFKETRAPDGAVCIELFDDSDDDAKLIARPGPKIESPEIAAPSSTKRLRVEIDLT